MSKSKRHTVKGHANTIQKTFPRTSGAIEELFPIPVYVTQVDKFDDIQKEITTVIESINFEMDPDLGQPCYLSDPTFKDSLFDNHNFPIFKKEIDRNLKIYAEHLNFEVKEYIFRGSWMALFEKNNYIHIHNHGYSDISGVYYYSRSVEDGNIFFESPVDAASSSLPYFGGTITVPGTTGTLLLFPGWLRHGIRPNMTDTPRVSLSFDIVFDRFAYSER